MSTNRFLAISGSLRKESYNSALLRAFRSLAPENVSVDLMSSDDLRAFPPYDSDVEATAYPAIATAYKKRIREADGVIIATPEYNRTMSGVLKNFLDWSARPYGDNPWESKPCYVIGASTGNISAALAQYDVKKVLLYFNARVLGQPEFYLGNAKEKFDEVGVLTDEATKRYIATSLAVFTDFVVKSKQ